MERSESEANERRGRRGEPDSKYDFIFTWAAGVCQISKQDVIECILQDDQVRDVHDFIGKDRSTLLLYHQRFHPSWVLSSEGSRPVDQRQVAVVNDERRAPLDETAVFYVKLNARKTLTEDNIHREVMVGMVDGDKDEELTCGLIRLISFVYQPLVENLLHFCDADARRRAVYEEILMAIHSLLSSLTVADHIFQHCTWLTAATQMALASHAAAAAAAATADAKKRIELLRQADVFQEAEKAATDWLSIIERENSQSEMLRCDGDEDTPGDEIEYWKTRSWRLNLLQQQLSGDQVSLMIQCLQLNRSKLLRRWTEALRKLSQASHESSNNTLFLTDFEHHCRVLYVWDPVRLRPCIAGLLSTVRLICCVSLYYNTSERITSLLIKITNELIRSCRRHVTNNGRETIWSRPADQVIPLLEDCLNLQQTYRKAYATMKEELSRYQQSVQRQSSGQSNRTPTAGAWRGDRQMTLTCSEHSVLGKFDAFCSRLLKIQRLYDVLGKHDHLFQGRLQGLLQDDEIMDEIERRHYAAVKDVTGRPYDYLNHRLLGFDQHLTEFEARLNDLKLYVGSYIEKVYNPVWESPQGMRFLHKFERIGTLIPLIAMETKHQRILSFLLDDLGRLWDLLETHGANPPVARNFSPAAGQIMWCCTLQRCLEQRLYEHAPILNSDLGRDVTRKCKNLLLSLAQIGVNLLRTWKILSLATVEGYLAQTVLVAQGGSFTDVFVVNFSPRILLMFQEVHCALQCGIRVPNMAAYIYSRRPVLLKMRDEAQYLAERYKRLLDSVVPELEPLLGCHRQRLYLTLKPASTTLCWNVAQSTWNKFFNLCRDSLEQFGRLLVRLEDVRVNRIERILGSLTGFSLSSGGPKDGGATAAPAADADAALTLEQFTERVRRECVRATVEIQERNVLLERAVDELIHLLLTPCQEPGKFFRIPTESIGVRMEPTPADRPRQSGRTNRSHKSKVLKSESGGSAAANTCLPPIGGTGDPAAKTKPASSKSQSCPKLPKLSSRPSSASQPMLRSQSTVLPPLARPSTATDEVKAPAVSGAAGGGGGGAGAGSSSSQPETEETGSSDKSATAAAAAAPDYGELIKQLEEGILAWKRSHSKKMLQILTGWLRCQLDQLRHWIVPPPPVAAPPVKNGGPAADSKHAKPAASPPIATATPAPSSRPVFLLRASYAASGSRIEISPSLDQVQEAVYAAGKLILAVTKGISRWSDRPLRSGTGRRLKKSLATPAQVQLYNVYGPVTDNKDVISAASRLSTCLHRVRVACAEQLRPWNESSREICLPDRQMALREFQSGAPSAWDWDQQLMRFQRLEAAVAGRSDSLRFGPVRVGTEQLKAVLLDEVGLWAADYKRLLYRQTVRDVERLAVVLAALERKLERPIRDLGDTRLSMETLRDIRGSEVEYERAIELVNEAVGVLVKHRVPLADAERQLVRCLRASWNRLQRRAQDHHMELVAVQPTFKRQLLENLRQFRADGNAFCADYERDGPMVQGLSPRQASERLVVFQNRFDALWRRQTSYEGGTELFGLAMPALAGLNRIRKELNLLQKLYRLYNDVTDRVAAYYQILWADVNIEEINNELIEFQNRCRKLPKGLKEWPAFGTLKRIIDDLSDLCPLLELMSNKAMKPRHWLRLSEMTGHAFQVDWPGFCLRCIVEAPLLQHKEEVEDICISALKEKDIEAKLRQVTSDWTANQLTFMTFKGRGELLLKGDAAADLISQLEDSLMVLSSLLTNRYNVPFRKPIQKWVTDLSNTNEILERWLLVQNLWVYLEAVFVGGDIAKQLPKEAKRFGKIDKAWQRIMMRAHENPSVVASCVADDFLAGLLPHLQEELELCQKSLSGYLEKKRLTFPRFFFVSDPALLEILGQASDSHTIQSHLLSIFDNTASVEFNDLEYDKILSIVSSEGESITLESPVRAEGSVEVWLMRLLQEAQRSLHSIIRLASQAISHADVNMMDFFAAFPSQVGILGLQMMWTRDAELALCQARFDRKVMPETNAHFLEVLNTLIDQATRNLDQVERIKFETLITIHVHQRDIFDQLWRQGVKTLLDFDWLKQFRFYFNTELDKLLISITDVSFSYQNEFLGCTERLVITPLTDRCYITLAQALHMCMGGCPSGPAGTGKTETTKDMGKTLGKYVVVFNCSDQMDFRGLGRIYKGLAQSGSWGCFDEFNRIDLPVLSVAAQQVAIVLACKREKRSAFVFADGEPIEMNTEFGIFLTMNPDYAGRQQLPENLKNQFRFVSMMVPDRQIIIRVKLASCGFLENITLARKFYTLYKLCEEQLTKQVHYDFGLRNILSVLRTLGASKRANPKDSETMIVMRVLRDMNLSKLVDEDEPLFLSLIGDLFPATGLDKTSYYKLEEAIEAQVKAAGLVAHPPWLLKLIQLYETQLVRHGIMILGPGGSGKTTCIQTLMKALTAIGKPHREMRMNPKAITCAQMFGRLDVATNDWTDGIFSALWRKTLKTKRGDNIWIVLDGPVDTLWIENLNSVLDDNRTLTLANGDRLPMSHFCKVIFEPHNIDNASPATVSRCGMVYMSSSGLDWRPLVGAWLAKKPPSEGRLLRTCFEESFSTVSTWSRQNLSYKMAVLECNIIHQAMALLEGLIPEERYQSSRDHPRSRSPTDSLPEMLDDGELIDLDPVKVQAEVLVPLTADWSLHLQRLYLFALVWSVGALLERADRRRLDQFIRAQYAELPYPASTGDEEDTVFDFVVNSAGQWEHWSTRVGQFVYPETATIDFGSMLVPNVDSVRIEYLVGLIAKQDKPVLLIGEQGSAKTVMINAYLKANQNDDVLHRTFNFSSATTPFQFQRMVEGCVDKRMGNTYGPPAGKKLVVFVDDINLPLVNEWGDQSTNEMARQLLEMGGFYSLEKPGEFSHIVDVHLIAAMIQPGGGRNDIPHRLKRHFCIFNCPLPSDPSMDRIFGTIALGHYSPKRGYSDEVRALVERLVPLTRHLWMSTKAKMLPTPAKFHYIFNLRDLSRIWQGMSSTLPSVVDSAQVTMALWKHECTRVIADRFTTQEDKDWFEAALIEHVRHHLGDAHVAWVRDSHYFVDFMRDAPEPTGDETEEADMELPKVYEPVASLDDLQDRLLMFLSQYNEMVRGNGMDLVFFRDAVEHLIKISRTLRHPGGNVLLVGVGGSGKQSLTKLASFIAGYKTFHISLTRSYNVANFLEDLKILYRTCGVQGKGTTFIFTDQDVKEEAFLEYLNSVLSSGTVSNLFNRDEQSEIVMELIPVMKREFPRRPPTPENVLEYFMSRVRQHLHIALCFSPVGEKFRSRALKFPGLISGCTLDWFQPWPREALIAVAHHSLENFIQADDPEMLADVEKALGSIQESVAETAKEYFQRYRRQVHVTPKTYLTFLSSYKGVFGAKAKEIGGMASRMESGLAKLYEASETVAQLKSQLVVMEQELAEASATAETVLVQVTQRAKEAEATKNQVQTAKDRAQRLVDVIAVEKAAAEEKLAAAKPALDEAEAALNTIKPAHIATVRKLGRPPQLIMRIMDCVLILFQRRIQPAVYDSLNASYKPSWNESLKLMASATFLQQLQNFAKESICDETVELLEPYFRADDYNMETAERVCGDVAGLLSWTRAMAFFFGVNKEVEPLKANLALQEMRLNTAMAELAKAEAHLAEKEAALDQVKLQYESAMREKKRLTEAAAVCRRKMALAANLISGLSGEKMRWTVQSRTFKEQLSRLVGDAILATAFLSYAGPFNQEFRGRLLDTWKRTLKLREIPFTLTLNVTHMLSETSQLAEWTLQGLPSDEHSVQNATIAVHSNSYPLLIDPQGQAKNWIKAKEYQSELQITSLNHKYFRTHLEDSLSLGRPLLIEDVGEELDPALDHLLDKNFIRSGTVDKVMIGDKDCDVTPGFALYLTTKLANPAYSPEVCSRVVVIDFTVTQRGLEDQLLGRVVSTERSELEAERVSVFESVLENKRLIKELEDSLLSRLTSTAGSLIDDEGLVTVLHETKDTAQAVNHKLVAAADMEHKINAAREEFRPVATRGSILYFLIVEMSQVNVMYQTSLRQFLHLFDASMAKATKTPNIPERVRSILATLNREVWQATLRGLYERHQFLFTLLMAIKIDLHAGRLTHAEFMKLIKGGASLDLNAVPAKPFKWILDVTWLNLVELSSLPTFADLLTQVQENEREWRAWIEREKPELDEIPCGYSRTLDPFRRLLLIRSWCPDRMLHMAQSYVVDSLGDQYIDAPLLDLEAMLAESEPRAPLICILTTCSDPSLKIEQLAKQKEVDIQSLSMGQGQEVPAARLLVQCLASGQWLLLQNCHLNLNFCHELLDAIAEAEQVHPAFRLWLTTQVHPQFPIGLLQTAIKFTNEPPQGVRASLKRTFADMSQDLLEYSSLPAWKTLLYTLAFMHTVLQERRKYGTLGWNLPYEFNQSDLAVCIQCVQNHLDDMDPKKGISWPTLCYMLGEAQYGGRVTDDFDKRLLSTFTQLWFSERLLQPTFEFYRGYPLPQAASLPTVAACQEWVASLPAHDSPEVLGLHSNADITYQINRAQRILDTIMSIQPKDGTSSVKEGETREAVVYRLVEDMLLKMPKEYVEFEVKEALQRMGALLPMSIFLRQEIDRMQRVIRKVRSVLVDLKLAIEGTIIMSPGLRQAMDSIYDARVPEIWRNISWESSTLGFWFTEFLERNAQFSRWCFHGKPKVFWMAGFFNPQGFLTAMRQEVTRAHKGWALDSVVLQSAVTRLSREEVVEPPAEGVYIHGLFLEGASLDRKTGKLMEAKPKILYEPMPVVYVYAVQSSAGKDPRMYECPIYRKPMRSTATYVGSVDLETDVNPRHWILRGVALLCDIK